MKLDLITSTLLSIVITVVIITVPTIAVNIYYMPGTELGLSHLIFTSTLYGKHYHTHFADE